MCIGDSGGESSSSNQTTSQDQRMVLDGGSIGVTGSSGNSVSINTLDAGAVKGALDLAGPIVTTALALASNVAMGAGKVLDRGVGIQEQQGAQLAAAYTDAKGQKDILIVGALLIGGVAIAFILKK